MSWLRALAVLGVVAVHTAGATAAEHGLSTPDGVVAVAMDIPFLWAVPVFVMLSGALLLDPARAATRAARGGMVRLRLRRLVPPLLLWHAVYLGYFALTRDGWLRGPGTVLERVGTGQVAPHLYFFWIVLGLSLLAPTLQAWTGRTEDRTVLAAGVAGCLLAVVSAWPLGPDGSALLAWRNAATWWVPFLGLFLLGHALRGRAPGRAGTSLAAAGAVVVAALLSVQWGSATVPEQVDALAPASYDGPLVMLLAVLVFQAAQGALAPGGPLQVLLRPGVLHLVTPVSDASLGVFALHVLVLAVLTDLAVLGPAVTAGALLPLRWAVAVGITLAVVLPLRRYRWARWAL